MSGKYTLLPGSPASFYRQLMTADVAPDHEAILQEEFEVRGIAFQTALPVLPCFCVHTDTAQVLESIFPDELESESWVSSKSLGYSI
jgi:hypothetical protein